MFDDVDQGIKAKILSLSDDEAQIVTDHLFNANGLVSEFNSILMCVANCNMALYPLGTASSAKAQFMYTCKYVTKCPTEIMSLLSILYNAAKHIENTRLQRRTLAQSSGPRVTSCKGFSTSCVGAKSTVPTWLWLPS